MPNILSAFSNKRLLFFLSLLLIAYLVINTGIISDEFDIISKLKGRSVKDIVAKDIFILEGAPYFPETPVQYLTHYLWYRFIGPDNQAVMNMLKLSYIILAFFLIAQFFRIYLDTYSAFLVSFLFIFFPSHDATVYCFLGQYLTLSFALYLYSFYLAYRNRIPLAFVSALIASFISYGSTPVALALFILFAFNKEFKKGAAIIIPNIIYAVYFIYVNLLARIGIPRIIEKVSITTVINQFLLQVLTFIDSMFGPSMWLKIYYSFCQLSVPLLLIGLIATVIFYKINEDIKGRYDPRLITSFTVLTLLSFVMFAFTGRYPQLAFNLGNRVTIFGSLLLAYLIVLMPASKAVRTSVFAVLIFTILGISAHWKSWNLEEQRVIANIRGNPGLKNYSDNAVIYVSGNQYSKYGPVSHIELFSEDWAPRAILSLALNKDMLAKSLNKRHKYMDGYLVDTKYNKRAPVNGYINIYDSEKNTFFKLKVDDINSYIDSLPPDNRHWV
ncbi:MAG: hypothetical protein Q8R31_03655, partial [Candidatus Omnitrophota bacterium]|nr:hypothetical protein [Candidatus Omnitrophota bacterium]